MQHDRRRSRNHRALRYDLLRLSRVRNSVRRNSALQMGNEVVDVKAHLTSTSKKKMEEDVPLDRRESSSQREFEEYLETVCKWHAWAVGAGDG